MAQLLRLIAGHDRRNPTRTFTIANSSSTANIHLFSGGFNPSPGKQNTRWSGKNTRRHGQKRTGSSRDNSRQVITYNLNGGSAAELGYLQREISRFFEEVRLYEEERQSTPCWLEYRWQDGLDDVPAPALGQFSYYIRILDGDPEWPKTIHAGNLVTGNIEQVICELTCEPFWEGLEQLAMRGAGQLQMTPHGVLVPPATSNLIPNPSFGHATFNTGWGVGSALLIVAQETRAGYYRSLKSAARLTNTDTVGRSFVVTLTLTAVVHYISCYVRKPDGSAVTSSDMQMFGQGVAQTTTFVQVDGGPGYYAYASFTGVAVSANHGVHVLAGKTVIIDDVQLEIRNATTLFPTPFTAGHLIGSVWAGTAHNSTSSRVESVFEQTLTNELTGEFTIAGWLVPHFTSGTGGGLVNLLQYFFDADNELALTFNLTTNVFVIRKTIAAVSASVTSGAQTIAYNDKIHIAITQTQTTLSLYINGVSVGTPIAAAPYLPAGADFSIGRSNFTASPAPGVAVDGWHVWRSPQTAAQVLSLYNAELEVKSMTGGGIIGMPPYFWNKDGDSILDAVNDTNRDNFGVVAGVPGDVEALTEWRIQPPTATPPRVFWLGRKVTDENFDAALLYLEFQGTVDANSSGGEYETQTSAAEMFFTKTITAALETFQGRYQYLGRLFVSTNSVVVSPRFHFLVVTAASTVTGDELTLATNANFLLRDLGDLFITYPKERIPPDSLVPLMGATPTTGSATVRADFIQLLPYPCCRVQTLDASLTISAGDLLIISGTEAYVRRTSTGAHLYTCEYRGEAVDVMPNKYNTIYFLPGEEGTQYDITDTGTFTVYITPRWLLPGGLVA